MKKIVFLIYLCCSTYLCANSFEQAADEIIAAGHLLNAERLCPATSGNISVRLDHNLAAITVSGKHKGELSREDIMIVTLKGEPHNSNKKPSAETLLHTSLYELFDDVGAVLHTHSLNGTVLTRLLPDADHLVTQGYEIHKAFPPIKTHESELPIPIFENSQDIPALAQEISEYLKLHPEVPGYLIRSHGFYTWGKDMKEAKIRLEAFEYLFECELKVLTIRGGN